MKRKVNKTGVVLLLVAIGISVWWSTREPYITMEGFSDPILVYHVPTWYGWESRGLKWISDLPEPMRRDWPDAEGWWHIVFLTIPETELPAIDLSDPDKSFHEAQKYYKWAPLGYKMPNETVLSNR